MSALIHADLMKLYAQDAAETDKPWERWQYQETDVGGWNQLNYQPSWAENFKYRRKPRTHTVNGFEVPEPMREAPEVGSKYWLALPSNVDYASSFRWREDSNDRFWLERGLIHATKEAAAANARAMIGVQP